MEWIHLAYDRVHLCAVKGTVMNWVAELLLGVSSEGPSERGSW
jgi:hypothetical protein